MGVYLSSPTNTIGGTATGAANLISGNTSYGVWLNGASATDDTIEGNLIGTDVTGTMAVANGNGVELDAGASSNTIGGLTATPGTGAGNLISGNNTTNAAGIDITGRGSSNNVVEGNVIGLGSGGTALGNTNGVEV